MLLYVGSQRNILSSKAPNQRECCCPRFRRHTELIRPGNSWQRQSTGYYGLHLRYVRGIIINGGTHYAWDLEIGLLYCVRLAENSVASFRIYPLCYCEQNDSWNMSYTLTLCLAIWSDRFETDIRCTAENRWQRWTDTWLVFVCDVCGVGKNNTLGFAYLHQLIYYNGNACQTLGLNVACCQWGQ